jgi:REP element-mobilizing transposase RayT
MGAANDPLGYLLTWTCYGTWLHGDDRGSVDLDHNAPGSPFLPPDEPRRMTEYHALRHEPVTLDDTARRIVHETILEHARIRQWEVRAVNVRTNHVHVVVQCGEVHPRKVIQQFKDWATRRLRAAGVVDQDTHVWTDGGSGRFLWDERSIANAIDYVMEYQGADLTNQSPVRKHRT